ncbi:MAG: prolipoprotein diacylglyceryl transferase [Clostridiaceae bacterium]|jgi:phosphatidylglycerol:prolipoprotein diacylglycerol transferase|nr:prolipoprotein diacylglyceryl transferase [Clostridiaceae bacterium]
MNYIEFPKLGIHLDINPRAVSNLFGTNISIHWYGIIIAVAIMVALWLAMRHSKKFNIKEDDLIDMFLVALPVSIVFARLFFVVFTWENYRNDLLGIFRIWEGGLAIYGAIIGAILSVYFYSRRKKIDMLNLCDFACVYLPLAQAIGRWGNFANQELYGTVTTLPWGMTGSIIGDDPVHPTFLYESILNIIVFVILLNLRKNRKVKGSVLAVYLMLYSLVRFMMEFLRTDEFGTGDIRYNQVFAALVFVGAFIWLIYLRKRSQKAALEAEDEVVEPSEYSEIVEKIKKEELEAEEAAAEENTPDDETSENENISDPEPAEEDNQPEAASEEGSDDIITNE